MTELEVKIERERVLHCKFGANDYLLTPLKIGFVSLHMSNTSILNRLQTNNKLNEHISDNDNNLA